VGGQPDRQLICRRVLYILQGKWGEQREELRVTPPRKRYLTEHEHRALQLLAGSPRGVTEELRVPGYGFKLQMLTGLADAKLGEAVPRERQRRRPNDWGHLHDDHRRRTEGAQGAARHIAENLEQNRGSARQGIQAGSREADRGAAPMVHPVPHLPAGIYNAQRHRMT
jgi:hypothetical protein